MNCEMLTQEGVQIAVCTPSGGFWWLTPLILSCSAITAAYLSVQSIRTNRDMARKKATLDLIVQTESTDYYQSLYRTFTDIRKDESGFAQIFSPSNPEIVKQRQMVLNYLNHYEIIAMGIADGILDEIVYKDYMRSTVVRDWFAAEPFIRHIREPSADSGSEVSASAAFSNFEALALKWEPEVKRSL